MKRLQIYIEPELDDALALEAHRRKTSKAALIRSVVAEHFSPQPRESDPLDAIVGDCDFEPVDVDEVVYGPSRWQP